MSSARKNAYQDVLHRETKKYEWTGKISEKFGENVFYEDKMREYLPEQAYKSIKSAIQHGTKIDRNIADVAASAMKEWALEKGATHYTHWFQPLNGATAEKHDAFIDFAEDRKSVV